MLEDLYEKITEQEKEDPEQGSLPEAWGILYAAPNLDGSRKMCQNCIMWSQDNKCSIHAAGVEVTDEHVCGYHVFGQPMDERMDHPGMDPVTSELSGLDVVPGGTSCDICAYFVEEVSLCSVAVCPRGELLEVDPKGCCARWDANPEEI